MNKKAAVQSVGACGEREDMQWRELSKERVRSHLPAVKATLQTLGKAQVVRRETLKSTISV